MNGSALMMALSTGRSAWRRYKDFREHKAADLYDSILDAVESSDGAAAKVAKKALDKLDDSAHDAGVLTKEARQRLEKALKEVREGSKNYIQDAVDAQESAAKKAKKMGKRTRRKAMAATEKAAGKAQKKVDKFHDKAQKKADKLSEKARKKAKKNKKGKRNWLIVALLAVLALAAGVFFLGRKKKEYPADNLPPRVEDYRTKPAAPKPDQKAEPAAGEAVKIPRPATPEPDQKAEATAGGKAGAKHRLIEDPAEAPAEKKTTDPADTADTEATQQD